MPAGRGGPHATSSRSQLHAASPAQVQLTFDAPPQGGKSYQFRAWARNSVAWSTGSLPELPVTLPPKVPPFAGCACMRQPGRGRVGAGRGCPAQRLQHHQQLPPDLPHDAAPLPTAAVCARAKVRHGCRGGVRVRGALALRLPRVWQQVRREWLACQLAWLHLPSGALHRRCPTSSRCRRGTGLNPGTSGLLMQCPDSIDYCTQYNADCTCAKCVPGSTPSVDKKVCEPVSAAAAAGVGRVWGWRQRRRVEASEHGSRVAACGTACTPPPPLHCSAACSGAAATLMHASATRQARAGWQQPLQPDCRRRKQAGGW